MTRSPALPAGDDGDGLVAGYIARWRPSSVSPRAAAFARDVIAAAAPGGRERAKNLLWAASHPQPYAASEFAAIGSRDTSGQDAGARSPR